MKLLKLQTGVLPESGVSSWPSSIVAEARRTRESKIGGGCPAGVVGT